MPSFVSAVTVQTSDDPNFFLSGTCVDVSPAAGSPDCNQGLGGDYTYVVKSYTSDRSQAINGLSVDITGSENPELGNMAKGTGGDYRYVITSRDVDLPHKISDVQLWRSPHGPVSLSDVAAFGWDGISKDINEDRAGAYLYLVWKIARG